MCRTVPETDERNRNVTVLDYVRVCAQLISKELSKLSNNIFYVINIYAEKYNCQEVLNFATDSLSDHPILRLGLSGCAVASIIPLLVFIVFAVFSILFTFLGFLLFECCVLLFATVFLIPFFLGGILFISLIAGTFTVIYFLAVKTGKILEEKIQPDGVLLNDGNSSVSTAAD